LAVAALSITETISWGIIYYTFPVFLRSMEGDLGASRVAVTGALSAALGVSAAVALPVGRWIDRNGPRALMTAGSCLAVALLLAWAQVRSLGALYTVWCLMGLAMAATLYEPAFVAIVQWFPRRRDRGLLIVTLAGGLASTIFMPIAAWLLGRFGWRATAEMLAGFLALTTIPLHALALRGSRRPEPGGPDGGAPAESDPDTERPPRDVPLGFALSTPAFWALSAAFAVGIFAAVAVTVHLIPYLVQRGYPEAYAAAIVGGIGAMQVAGRLVFAPVAAWFGSRIAAGMIFLVQGAGMALLTVAAPSPGLWGVIMLLGAANGMATLARAMTVADLFGRTHYGSISGAIAVASTGARALGPVGASLLRIWLGGYDRVFWTLGVALAVAGLTVMVIGSSARREDAAETV
jgi:MFS family permease